MSELLKDLLAAVALLRTPGVWAQGQDLFQCGKLLELRDDCHCIVTAIDKVTDTDSARCPAAIEAVAKTLGLPLGDPTEPLAATFELIKWNDHKSRTHQEVIGALTRTITRVSLEEHHRQMYESIRIDHAELPAWEDLTEEQREKVRKANQTHIAQMDTLGRAIASGEIPTGLEIKEGKSRVIVVTDEPDTEGKS